MIKDYGTDKDMYSPCCFNSLAKPCGIKRYRCVKCGKIWRIENDNRRI